MVVSKRWRELTDFQRAHVLAMATAKTAHKAGHEHSCFYWLFEAAYALNP